MPGPLATINTQGLKGSVKLHGFVGNRVFVGNRQVSFWIVLVAVG
jgi:hypothetical protein